MRLQKHKTAIIIAIILTSLIGLAIIQIGWLNKAIATNKQIFIQNMDSGAQQASDLYRNTNNLPENIHDLITETTSNSNEIDGLVKPLLNNALEANNLPLNYTYGIYKHEGNQYNKLVYGTTDLDILESTQCNQTEDRDFAWTNLTCNLDYSTGNSYHLAIFPSYTSYIFNEVKYSLFAFILFLSLILVGFNYLLKTITKQKRISEIKNDFINNLTHEFKTPIFSMSLASKALRKSFNTDDKRNAYIDVLDHENTRLRLHVDKILQLSLVDSDMFQLQKKQINIHKQLEAVSENLQLVLAERNGRIHFNFGATKHQIFVDDIHLRNVWYNILDNAIKYTHENPIIEVETINKADMIEVSISDNGIGMTADKQKAVFDKFYRVSTGDIHSTKGFGIGLSYAKRIIELHGGSITVSSRLNFGTTFKIIIPINDN